MQSRLIGILAVVYGMSILLGLGLTGLGLGLVLGSRLG